MAFREGIWENLRGVTGLILSLRRLGTTSVGGNAAGFRTGKLERARTGVDPKMLARIESQKNLAVLFSQRTQIR